MSEPVSPGADFSLVTGDKEVVTLTRPDRRTGATLAALTGVHALRGLVTRVYPAAPQGGELPTDVLQWQVRADHVTWAGGLRKGDRLTDGTGAVWVCAEDVTLPRGSGVYVVKTTRVQG